MTDLEKLVQIVADLQAENAALVEVILDSQGLLAKEVVSSVPEQVGKIPWYIRQQKLTKLFRKSKVEDTNADEKH